jgi:hypothetical protein
VSVLAKPRQSILDRLGIGSRFVEINAYSLNHLLSRFSAAAGSSPTKDHGFQNLTQTWQASAARAKFQNTSDAARCQINRSASHHHISIASVDAEGAILASGKKIPAATVIWCAGMRADPLTARFPVGCDRLGRLPVDPYLKINGISALAPSRALASARMSVKRR